MWGRFVNADAFAAPGQGLLGNNMFAYCRNNPVCRIDIIGYSDIDVEEISENGSDDRPEEFAPAGTTTGNTYPSSCGDMVGGEGPSHTSSDTVIYRFGYTGPEKLVPSVADVADSARTGLSFSTKYAPGAAKTTIEAVNSTGILFAIQDGKRHVSIYPVNATLAEWHAAGVSSIWTQTLIGVITLS